jgi:hypothetical protein
MIPTNQPQVQKLFSNPGFPISYGVLVATDALLRRLPPAITPDKFPLAFALPDELDANILIRAISHISGKQYCIW